MQKTCGNCFRCRLSHKGPLTQKQQAKVVSLVSTAWINIGKLCGRNPGESSTSEQQREDYAESLSKAGQNNSAKLGRGFLCKLGKTGLNNSGKLTADEADKLAEPEALVKTRKAARRDGVKGS